MTNTNIKFDKRKLESVKSNTKPTWYYAQNFEKFALVVLSVFARYFLL